MAVPTLPSDETAATVYRAPEVNVVYEHLKWFRDTRPLFSGTAQTAVLVSAERREIGHGSVAETFGTAADINVGGWTVSATPNTSDLGGAGDGGLFNLTVPEAGIYEGYWQVGFEADSTGRRLAIPMLNRSSISGTSVQVPTTAAGVCNLVAMFQVDCKKVGDELSCSIMQNSGSQMNQPTAYLHVRWVQST